MSTISRPLAATLASLLTLACGDNGDMQITQTNPNVSDSTDGPTGSPTADPSGDPSGDPNTATSDPATTQGPTTDPSATTPTVTGDPVTTGPTGDTGDTSDTGDTGDTASSSESGDDGNLMTHYGAPCATDADCQKLLGADGVCLKDILGVYALPGGYCSILCQLPDQQTTYLLDAPGCTMMADCVGLMGYFEGCAHVCTDNSQCPREEYECRQMPQISNPDDPKFCLMTEDNMIPP